MKILVTGGTGFIGQALCQRLVQRGDEVWVYSRRPGKVASLFDGRVQALESLDAATTGHFDAVINLAGESIAGGLWTRNRKAKLRDSRIALTEALCAALARNEQPPKIFISGSATGYYGDGGDTVLSETSEPLTRDFAQQLCADWEAAALKATSWGARVVRLRIGLVMGPGGGFLAPLKLPFSLGLGGRLGSGRQWMSWISLHDMVSVICRVLDDDTAEGVYNAVAPAPITNAAFTGSLASRLNRPAFMHVPAFVLRLLLGELATLLLGGQRVLPARLQQENFVFRHPQLEAALEEI